MRPSLRRPDQMRVLRFTRGFTRHAEGSVLAEFGDTRVLCTASIEERVPPFLKGKGSGWITAEYGMLPRSTNERMQREAARGKQGGRTLEIQRLIGRSLRAAMDQISGMPVSISVEPGSSSLAGSTASPQRSVRMNSPRPVDSPTSSRLTPSSSASQFASRRRSPNCAASRRGRALSSRSSALA